MEEVEDGRGTKLVILERPASSSGQTWDDDDDDNKSLPRDFSFPMSSACIRNVSTDKVVN